MNTIVGSIKERLKGKSELGPYEHINCKAPGCNKYISTNSESAIVGGWCAACRDKTVPSYVPLEQQGLYLDKILEGMKKQHAREEEESLNKYSKQKSKSKRITEICRNKYLEDHWNTKWKRRVN